MRSTYQPVSLDNAITDPSTLETARIRVFKTSSILIVLVDYFLFSSQSVLYLQKRYFFFHLNCIQKQRLTYNIFVVNCDLQSS